MLNRIVARTAATRLALVHGNVSPKNILVGSSGPVLLDAECAWYGDPAFDVAFLATHLLLKSCVIPQCSAELQIALLDFLGAYAAHVTWEPLDDLQRRSAELLAAMLLARVDGKSPVDYLSEDDRSWVRAFARAMLLSPCISPQALQSVWFSQMR